MNALKTTILGFTLLLMSFALLSNHAPADEAYSRTDPRSVIARAIRLVDRHALPDWPDPSFPKAMKPYLTPELIAAVVHGSEVARRKNLDLYDGEFFTGAQGVARARLFDARIIKSNSDSAEVLAMIGTADEDRTPKIGGRNIFQLKRIDGVWKIDDFRSNEPHKSNMPWTKALFSDPEKYIPPAIQINTREK